MKNKQVTANRVDLNPLQEIAIRNYLIASGKLENQIFKSEKCRAYDNNMVYYQFPRKEKFYYIGISLTDVMTADNTAIEMDRINSVVIIDNDIIELYSIYLRKRKITDNNFDKTNVGIENGKLFYKAKGDKLGKYYGGFTIESLRKFDMDSMQNTILAYEMLDEDTINLIKRYVIFIGLCKRFNKENIIIGKKDNVQTIGYKWRFDAIKNITNKINGLKNGTLTFDMINEEKHASIC